MGAKPIKKYNHAFSKIKKGTKGYSSADTVKFRILARQNSLKIAPTHTAVIKRYMNKAVTSDHGALDIRLTHNFATSKKPLQSRMGKGKGRPESTSGTIFKGMPIANVHIAVKQDKLARALKKVAYRIGIHFKCRKVNKKPFKNVDKIVTKRVVQDAVRKIDECLHLIDERKKRGDNLGDVTKNNK